MSRPRIIDYDECSRLRAEGWTYKRLAARYGVSEAAVFLASNPEARARAEAQHAAWQRTGECPDCGAQTTRYSDTLSARCRPCSDRRRAVTVRDDELQCVTCQQWHPDESFPRARNEKQRRGRHSQCKPCNNAARQAYRERNKTPCRGGCGRKVMAPNERRRGQTWTGLCPSCYQRARRAA